MKKPKNTKHGRFECYEDNSGYEITFVERDGWPTMFIKSWRMTLRDIKRLHAWLGQVIKYIESRQRKHP